MNDCKTLTQAPMQFVRVNGVELAYFEMGEGIPLLMIHGWPGHSYGWRRLAASLGSGYRVIAPDMRGCGDSQTVPSGFDKRTLAADIKALLDHLGLEKIIAVGHDWGVPIAFRLTFDSPSTVAGVIFSQGRLPLLASSTTLMYSPQQTRERWYMNFNYVPDLPEIVIGRSIEEYFTYLCAHFSGDKMIHSHADMQELFRVLSRSNGLRAGLGFYRTAIAQDVEDWKVHASHRMMAPALALWAARDPLLPLEYMKGFEEYVPDLTLKVHETAAHFLPEEDPEWCATHIRNFVSQRFSETAFGNKGEEPRP